MSDLDHLKRRVGHAVERLAEVHNARRDRQESLLRLLSQLEVKHQARHEELSYCHSRIVALEKSNSQLSELLETVVQTVELSYADDADDPIVRAAELAAELVGKVAGQPAVASASEEVTATVPAPEQAPARTATPERESSVNDIGSPGRNVHAEASPGNNENDGDVGGSVNAVAESRSGNNQEQADTNMSFEVITAQELALEDQKDREAGKLPPSVVQAVTAARQSATGQERPWERKIADALAKVALAAEALEADDENADLPDIPGIENTVSFDIVDVDVASMDDQEISAANSEGGVRDLMGRLKKAAENAPAEAEPKAEPRDAWQLRKSSGTDDPSHR